MFRQKDGERRLFFCWFTLQMATTARAELIQSQELVVPDVPRGCRVPRTLAVLCYFPRPLVGSWIRSEVART